MSDVVQAFAISLLHGNLAAARQLQELLQSRLRPQPGGDHQAPDASAGAEGLQHGIAPVDQVRRTSDGQAGLSEPTTRPASSSAGPQQDHRLGGERLTRAYDAKVIGGGGLDVHRARLDRKRRSQAAPDLLAVGAQPRGLRQQRDVGVLDAEAGGLAAPDGLLQQLDARRVPVTLVAVREEGADVAQARGAADGVDQRVADDVGVTVALQAQVRGQLHPAQPPPPADHQSVDVEADPHPHTGEYTGPSFVTPSWDSRPRASSAASTRSTFDFRGTWTGPSRFPRRPGSRPDSCRPPTS